jgi:acyl-CoA dehydrogenase
LTSTARACPIPISPRSTRPGVRSCGVSFDTEIAPYAEEWDEAGHIPDALWPKAAQVGLLGLGYPEAYGGTSEGIDSWHQWITNEELNRFAVGGVPASLMVHGIGLPPVLNWGQRR